MPSATLVLFFEVVSLLGSGLTALKLFRSGLHRRYRVFFAYFVFRVPYLACILCLDVKSNAYLYFWVVTEPLIWIFYILVVLELYGLVLEKHKGLYTLGRWAMYLAMAVSLTLSVLSLLPRITAAIPQRSKVLGYFFAAERGIDFSLAIFILLILLFLSLYPVPLSRNVKVYAVLYAVYFLSSTLASLLQSLFGLRLMNEAALLLMGTSAGCVVAWLFLLSSQGEEVRSSIPRFGPEHEERILAQLDALNRTLLRISRN
jgi:hypothetical protein